MERGGARRPQALLIASVAIGGLLAVGAAFLAEPVRFDAPLLHHALALLVITAAAELVAIPLQHGGTAEKLTLFDVAVVADVVLLPTPVAIVVALGGQTLALAIHRKQAIKYAFNLGQYALAIVPVAALFHTIGRSDFSSAVGALSVFAGMAIFALVNLLLISAVIAAFTERTLTEVLESERGLSLAMGVGNAAVGMVAVSLYFTQPLLVPAVLAPALALHMAFKGWVQQKELTRRVQDESTKLGRILEHSSEGIVLADAEGGVLLWSPSMERITGISAEEAAGKALPYLLRGRNVYGQSLAVDVSASPDVVELEVLAADGTPRWLRAQHGPGLDERGGLTFDVVVVTDVTRQREVERLKDDFIATVSHELRTPLTPIKGYATLLLRRADEIPGDRRREALQSILERTDHMARLVEDLLLASRIGNVHERRMPEVNRQVVELSAVCERALRSFRAAHPAREFAVRAPEPVAALGDPIRIEQIVANLVSNAVKFSDDGTPVEVEIARADGGATLSVRDEGRGIPADRHEEIFEKFKRLEDPLRMETGGAGLGLFIVRQLALAMGGAVSVRSDAGRGSTFTVTLPLASAGASGMPYGRRDTDAPLSEDLAG